MGRHQHLGNRVEGALLEVRLRNDRDARNQNGLGLFAVLALRLYRLVVPVDHVADAGKAELLELADDLLCGHLGPLGPDAHDFRNASGHLNHRRHLAGR